AVLCTENVGLSASKPVGGGGVVPFKREMVELSASKPVGGGGAVPFSTEIVRLPASGAVATVIVGTLCGSKGSDPLAASTTSGKGVALILSMLSCGNADGLAQRP